MKKTNWFLGAILSIVGLLIIIFPAACVKIVSVLLGLAAIAYGIFTLIDSKNIFQDQSFFKTSTFIKSIASIVLGLLTVIIPLAVASTAWKIMVYIFAVYLLLAAALGFYTLSVLKDQLADRKRYIIENLSLLVSGVLLILISPEKLGIVIIRIVGIAALLVGIVFLAIQIMSIVNHKDTIIVDAEVVDADSADTEVVDEKNSDK
ncbi:MAG: hypothetical protein K5866_10685 [Treponema sp.]|nr:hypothetical protein [Treponema sp.]